MSTNMFRRTAVGALAIAGALGLAACNSDSPTVDKPTSAASSAAPTSESTTDESPSTSEETSPSEEPTPEESTTTSEETSPSEGGTPADGPTEATDARATLKIGQPAVIVDGDDTFRLTPKALEVAPDSVFSTTKLKRSNGTVYYLKFDVAAIKTNSTYFGTNSVNGLFFHPQIDPSVKGAKRLYGDTPACSSDSKKLAAGESASSCYIYQVPGKTVTNVVYNDHDHAIRWAK